MSYELFQDHLANMTIHYNQQFFCLANLSHNHQNRFHICHRFLLILNINILLIYLETIKRLIYSTDDDSLITTQSILLFILTVDRLIDILN